MKLYRFLTVSPGGLGELVLCLVFGLWGGSTLAHEVLDYEEDVRPILQKNCGGLG